MQIESEGALPEYNVTASNFMVFHTILRTSVDFTQALKWARDLTDSISVVINQNRLDFAYCY